MFERARLTLTAWYVGALVLTVVGIGAVSYRLLRDDLQSEIDDSLQTAARELSARRTRASQETPRPEKPPSKEETRQHAANVLAMLSGASVPGRSTGARPGSSGASGKEAALAERAEAEPQNPSPLAGAPARRRTPVRQSETTRAEERTGKRGVG